MTDLAVPVLPVPLVALSRSSTGILRNFNLPSGPASSQVKMDVTTDDLLGDWWRAYLNGMRPDPDTNHGVLRVAELFCGPGGLAQGAKQACRELGYQFESKFAADHDSDALAVYAMNHGTKSTTATSVSMLVDHQIRGRGTESRFKYEPTVIHDQLLEYAGKLDLLLAGPPCQGHSNLNNHTRRNDNRNDLYLNVPALAIAANIPMVVIENVTAIVHDNRAVVDTTIQLLEDHGYHVSTGVLRADKLGWPQTRGRFFLVARRDTAPIPLEEIASELSDEPRDVMWAIEDLVDIEPDVAMNRRPRLSDDNIRRIDWLFDNSAYDLALDQRPDCHKDGTTYTAVYGRMYPDRPSPTLTTGFMTPGRGRFVHPIKKRVLTPHEAARIQGFPDTYRWREPDEPEPKSQLLAKWIGDAVPMPLGHAAALSVLGPGLPT